MNSLRWRLLFSAGAVLLVFIILSSLALEKALSSYAHQAENERLQGLVFSILGAIEINDNGIANYTLERVPEPRLSQPDSGLVVVIYDAQGKPIWQSDSLLQQAEPIQPMAVNQWHFSNKKGYELAFGFEWAVGGDKVSRFGLSVRDTASPLLSQRDSFARQVWLWLTGMAVVLLLILLGLMHWGLKPLQRIRKELDAVRGGEKALLSEAAPDEIQPLTHSINAFLEHEARLREQFFHATSDLAHSLKTPIAVLRNQPETTQVAQEQLKTMESIINYQLRRATTMGPTPLANHVEVFPIVSRIIRALEKVYADQKIRFENKIPSEFKLAVSKDDLFEVLGNLLDNAAKYGSQKVVIDAEGGRLIIEDDGKGFPEDAELLLQRGNRADTRKPGQGIGLSVANEVMRSYGGKIEIDNRVDKGARLILDFNR